MARYLGRDFLAVVECWQVVDFVRIANVSPHGCSNSPKACSRKRTRQVEQPMIQHVASAADVKNTTLSTLQASRFLSSSPEPSHRVKRRDTFLLRVSDLDHCFVQAP